MKLKRILSYVIKYLFLSALVQIIKKNELKYWELKKLFKNAIKKRRAILIMF